MEKLIKSIKSNRKETITILAVMFLYCVNNFALKKITHGFLYTFLTGYLNDLMAPLFLLSYANILLDTRGTRIFRLLHIELFCLLSGYVWEYIAPLMKEGSVTDPLDIVCYLVGGFLYWLIIRRRNKK